jgi:hypothetical protein
MGGHGEPPARPDHPREGELIVSPNRRPVAKLGNRLSGTSPTNEEIKVGRAVADALAEELVKRISALGLPAERASGGRPPEGTLVIEGRFFVAQGWLTKDQAK